MIPIGIAATSYSKKIDDWADINKNLKIVYTNSEDEQHEQSLSTTNDWKGEYGKINKAMILKYLDDNILNNSIFYICGPLGMLKAMQALLQEVDLNIPKKRTRLKNLLITDD